MKKLEHVAKVGDSATIYKQLATYNRDPFRKILADALSVATTPEELRDFAAKSPDRYAQFITMFTKMSGYNDQVDVNVNVMQRLDELSDAELMMLVDQKMQGLIAAPPQVDDETPAS